MDKKIKAFHGFVNFGTQSGLFAQQLRNEGIDALSVTTYDKFRRKTDIVLLHGGNPIEKLFKHTWNWLRLIYWFSKYNTFHFYYGQTMFPYNYDLPLYKLFKKKLIFEYLGGDVTDYATIVKRYSLPKTHRFSVQAEKVDDKKKARIQRQRRYSDIQLVCAPCYSEYVPGSKVLPLGLDLSSFKYHDRCFDKPLVIMHAPTDMEFKGSKYILEALERLKDEGHSIIINLVTNVSHAQLLDEYKRSHIFIDQISIGWYGTASIEAMATGCPTACFLDSLYYQYIDYGNTIPIVSITKETVYQSIKDMIKDKDRLKEISLKSRLFVENTHDVKSVTRRLIEIYNEL